MNVKRLHILSERLVHFKISKKFSFLVNAISGRWLTEYQLWKMHVMWRAIFCQIRSMKDEFWCPRVSSVIHMFNSGLLIMILWQSNSNLFYIQFILYGQTEIVNTKMASIIQWFWPYSFCKLYRRISNCITP